MAELARKHMPRSWRIQKFAEVEEQEVSRREEGKITGAMPSFLIVTSVVKIVNPYIFGFYQLKKAEYKSRYGSVNEMTLYHATCEDNVDSIIRSNLDWSLSVRTKFGQGVSFSPSPKYADTHCNRNAGTERAMIVASVLVKRTHTGCYDTEVPKKGYDTTTGNRNQVYVKYSDNEFYPEYVIYYSSDDYY